MAYAFQIGDVVTSGWSSRRMIVVDVDEDRAHVLCAWRASGRERVYEVRYPVAALLLRRRAGVTWRDADAGGCNARSRGALPASAQAGHGQAPTIGKVTLVGAHKAPASSSLIGSGGGAAVQGSVSIRCRAEKARRLGRLCAAVGSPTLKRP